MNYYRETETKDKRKLILRSAFGTDAKDFIEYFDIAHSETDFLTTYPDESQHEIEIMETRLEKTRASKSDVEICAFVDGRLVGSAGINMVKDREKTRHRAEFGISVIRDYWSLGIGSELTKACIETAKQTGYMQIELEVVSENKSALSLYRRFGFVEYGRNPKAFRTRQGQWQELVLMRLEL